MAKTASARDVENALAEVQAGGAPRALVLGRPFDRRLVVPVILLNIICQVAALWPPHRQDEWMHWAALLANVAALASILVTGPARLRISAAGIETEFGFRRRFYAFTDMRGAFAAVPRKFSPGFDIFCETASGKRLRIGRFDVVERTLFELLRAYQARAG